MNNRRTGFTLIEVLLALGLTVVIMAAIMSAIRLYLFQLDRQRAQIEQKQISRGVIRMVSGDLRAAIQFKAEDYSGLENLIASQSLAGIGGLATGVDSENIDAEQLEQGILDAVAAGGGTGGGEEESSTGNGGNGAGNSEEEMVAGEDEQAVDEEEEEVPGRPTLIGNNQFIRIDTSRLPRIDEYNPLIVRSNDTLRLPSDIKTITYFFSKSAPLEQDPVDSDFGKQGGLYRRQIDRAVESYLGGDEDLEIVVRPDEYCELVSPEIAALQFRYWDGDQWLAEWDSSEQGGFPAAVEVQVVIDPERIVGQVSVADAGELDVESVRTVIHLPVAEIIADETGEMEDER